MSLHLPSIKSLPVFISSSSFAMLMGHHRFHFRHPNYLLTDSTRLSLIRKDPRIILSKSPGFSKTSRPISSPHLILLFLKTTAFCPGHVQSISQSVWTDLFFLLCEGKWIVSSRRDVTLPVSIFLLFLCVSVVVGIILLISLDYYVV